MPITSQRHESWFLRRFIVDMDELTIRVSMRRELDGVHDSDREFLIEKPDAVALLTAQPSADLSRADDATTAVYHHLVAAGLIVGTVS